VRKGEGHSAAKFKNTEKTEVQKKTSRFIRNYVLNEARDGRMANGGRMQTSQGGG